jgi:dihydroflavonol-4-reductase
MRVLVTGATGFLGRPLVDALLAAGHEVVALARDPASAALPEAVTVRAGDVLDGASVRKAAEGCAALLHCAGKVSRLVEDAELLYRTNVEGTKVTLDAARAVGVSRVVLASTSGTIAVSRRPVELSEAAEAPVDILASWPYYRSKLYAEKAALERNLPGFEVLTVNPSLLLGPGDLHGSSTEDVVRFLDGRVPFVPAGGLSFVDARDAALAMALALEKGRAGQRYLVGAANMTIAAFFGRLERLSGVKAPRLPAPKSPLFARLGAELLGRVAKHLPVEPIDPITAEMSAHFFYLDASKAKRELGWEPRDPMVTLADTIDDLRARGVVWPAPTAGEGRADV